MSRDRLEGGSFPRPRFVAGSQRASLLLLGPAPVDFRAPRSSSCCNHHHEEAAMQYMLLIYGDEAASAGMTDAERGALFGEYGAYTQGLRDSGAFVAGDPLQPTSAATTVQVRDGEQLVTDGPFAETKEQLGGYYIVEAESLDEAIELASKIPSARFGSIEVRPIMSMAGVPA
jgi:hypothetical protein